MVISLKKTFSLVELLICMAIVGLLISLLSPSLNSMIKAARQTQCQNKMRLIIQAQYLRAEDNSGYFGKSGSFDVEPFEGYFDQLCQKVYGTQHIGFYGVEIAPYFNKNLNEEGWTWLDFFTTLRNPNEMDFLLCPSDEEPTRGVTLSRFPLTQWQRVLTSFLMNGNLLSKTSTYNTYLNADSRRVDNPSTLMMISDANNENGRRFTTTRHVNVTYYDLVYGRNGVSRDNLAIDRHGDPYENNVGFVDGHVIKASIDDFKNIYVTQSLP